MRLLEKNWTKLPQDIDKSISFLVNIKTQSKEVETLNFYLQNIVSLHKNISKETIAVLSQKMETERKNLRIKLKKIVDNLRERRKSLHKTQSEYFKASEYHDDIVKAKNRNGKRESNSEIKKEQMNKLKFEKKYIEQYVI